MPALLLEVGTEELPATFVRKATTDLAERLKGALREARLLEDDLHDALGTPRRLIVHFPHLADRQPDAEEVKRGPGVKAAYDAQGDPTPALLGFCRGQGVSPESVRTEGDYVWVTKPVPGRPAPPLLAEILPKAIRGLTFEKSMRWGASRMRFARPLRWILATLDGETVPFEIEGVRSGDESRGHRFYAPETFSAPTYDALIRGLRERRVEPDPERREEIIREGAHAVANGEPEIAPALLEENVFLTEWPTPVAGEFPEGFMALPEPVLVTAMAKHERMFPVRDRDGKLRNRFVFVRNSGEDDTVRRGAEWVLNARFNDAKFFYDEDLKRTLDEFLERTATIVFGEGLGTVRGRADRLARLAGEIADATGADAQEREWAVAAGRLAKADLATGLVSELASLQGIVGGQYARREGLPGAVAWALETQYDPLAQNRNPASCDGERTALRLAMADALDKLAGYLGLGKEPTGSSDPFALRRAATVLIEIAWLWPGALPPYDALFQAALAGYREQGFALDERGAHAALGDLFEGRYEALLEGVRHDVREAALLREYPWEGTAPQGVRFRVQMLEGLRADAPFVQTATRPMNLVTSAKRKGAPYAFDDPLRHVDVAALADPNGEALLTLLKETEEPVFRAARERNVEALTAQLRRLEEPVNRFIDGAMILTDDEGARYARLTLLHAAALQLLSAGDFTRLEG